MATQRCPHHSSQNLWCVTLNVEKKNKNFTYVIKDYEDYELGRLSWFILDPV